MTAAVLLLAFVTAERLAELVLARRNTAKLLNQGAYEVGAKHYPAIVILHGAWLVGLWWLGWEKPIDHNWLVIFAILQVLRIWTLATLGPRWTTRILVLPKAPLVRKGPYKFLTHPNYVVVVGELAVLPMCLGLPLYALVFSVLNAVMLTIRIRVENAALSGQRHAAMP